MIRKFVWFCYGNCIVINGEGSEKMRSLKPMLIIIALAISLLLTNTTFADRYSGGGGHKGGYYRGGGHHGGHYRGAMSMAIGGPFWGPAWYYPSYYPYDPYYSPYYTSVVEVPSTPPVYIERSEPADDSSTPSGIWYYCPDSKAYYPYVMECPGGWQTVPAQPPSEPRR